MVTFCDGVAGADGASGRGDVTEAEDATESDGSTGLNPDIEALFNKAGGSEANGVVGAGVVVSGAGESAANRGNARTHHHDASNGGNHRREICFSWNMARCISWVVVR